MNNLNNLKLVEDQTFDTQYLAIKYATRILNLPKEAYQIKNNAGKYVIYMNMEYKNKEIKSVKKDLKYKPVSFSDIPSKYKDPDKHYAFIDISKLRGGWSNVNQKIAEGYEIDRDIVNKMKKDNMFLPPTLDGSRQIDGAFIIAGESLLMSMPKEMHDDKLRQQEERTNRAFKNIDEKIKEKNKEFYTPG